MKLNQTGKIEAFSLVEVVIALGILSFAVIAIMGLFTTGLQSTKESEQQIQAANLASLLITLRATSPTNDIPNLPNFAIPTTAMTNYYKSVYGGAYAWVGSDGQTTASVSSAAFAITCQAGTNLLTGSSVAQVYLMLSWPPQVNPTNMAAGHYELITQIPLR